MVAESDSIGRWLEGASSIWHDRLALERLA